MIKDNKFHYEPDYTVHPGEILEETLEARGISKSDFSEKTDLSKKHVSLILNGKAPVTPESAIKFEHILGVKASIWLNLNTNYQLFYAREAERKGIQTKIAWAKRFPIKELTKRGFITKGLSETNIIKSLLEFFSVGSISAWEKQFRHLVVQFRQSPSFEGSQEATAAWLQVGQNNAGQMDINVFDKDRFRKSLKGIRHLTHKDPEEFEPEMKELCANAGVALVFVPEFKKTHLSGAACWYSHNNAVIIMSLRHKSDDHFWFTFFHEAGHVILHKKSKIIVDGKNLGGNKLDDEANNFSADFLIEPQDYNSFILNTPHITQQKIIEFARKINIAPGIVVGRLQKDGRLKYNWNNQLKRRFELVAQN